MSRADLPDSLMPSILDRLTDPDSGGTKARPWYNLDKMLAVVRADLVDLLNTRQSHGGIPADLTLVNDSIVAYGLPDLTSLKALTRQQREDIGRILEDAIRRFEPRLRDVHATLVEDTDGKERMVRFRIEGRLLVEPGPEEAFNTILELKLTTGQFKPSEA